MKMSGEKTIDTLVEDINTLVGSGTKNPDKGALFAFASTVMDSVRRQLYVSSMERRAGSLRMSNIGKPCTRSLWYDINGDKDAELLRPETKIKFMMGDIVEALLIYLAQEAGHKVTNQQAEIEIEGIKGHIDSFIDGELVDIKSSSSYGMKKFKNGTLPDDDPFGYIDQISGYANAFKKKQATFVAFDKSTGEIATYTHTKLSDTAAKIKKVKADTSMEEPPERAFAAVLDKQSGGKKLGVNCSYCSHKATCWAVPGIDTKFRSGRPVFLVKGSYKEKASVSTF
jgi:hypothetical protein|tara:strand:+ start:129 stop:980 length:852 start_codon:yes stop_codon:yes gene_type:complete